MRSSTYYMSGLSGILTFLDFFSSFSFSLLHTYFAACYVEVSQWAVQSDCLSREQDEY